MNEEIPHLTAAQIGACLFIGADNAGLIRTVQTVNLDHDTEPLRGARFASFLAGELGKVGPGIKPSAVLFLQNALKDGDISERIRSARARPLRDYPDVLWYTSIHVRQRRKKRRKTKPTKHH